MSGLAVERRAPTAKATLVPSYDEESNVLTIESPMERPWPFGVNIDGLVLLDLDDERVLAAVEILVPRGCWKKVDALPDWPLFKQRSDLILKTDVVATKMHRLPVSVVSDKLGKDVFTSFGSLEPDHWVQLADNALAAIRDGDLQGFRVRLEWAGDLRQGQSRGARSLFALCHETVTVTRFRKVMPRIHTRNTARSARAVVRPVQ